MGGRELSTIKAMNCIHNSRVLTMLPRSSKIKGYKGVITYGQKKGQKKMKYGYARVSTRQQDL